MWWTNHHCVYQTASACRKKRGSTSRNLQLPLTVLPLTTSFAIILVNLTDDCAITQFYKNNWNICNTQEKKKQPICPSLAKTAHDIISLASASATEDRHNLGTTCQFSIRCTYTDMKADQRWPKRRCLHVSYGKCKQPWQQWMQFLRIYQFGKQTYFCQNRAFKLLHLEHHSVCSEYGDCSLSDEFWRNWQPSIQGRNPAMVSLS